MGRMTRGSAMAGALVASLVVATPVDAGPAPGAPIAYTCDQDAGDLSFPAEVAIAATDTPDPARIFQPVTWTFEIDEPALEAPLAVALHYLRVRMPRPADLANVSARAVAPAGETLNPPLNEISVQVTSTEIVLQIPAVPDADHRIRAGTDGSLVYPYEEGSFFPPTTPVVLPNLRVTGTPTPAAVGVVEWQAPSVESQATVLDDEPTFTCTPDGETPPVVATTTVSNQRQLCDGRGVTVQLGFNAPSAANDVIQGTPGNDTTNGLAGNDRFCGLNGIDTFRGSTGNDRAFGGNGNDVLRGDAGDDRLQGDAGADNLQGGADRDALIGGTQRDTCNGGPQRDTAQTCEVRSSIP